MGQINENFWNNKKTLQLIIRSNIAVITLENKYFSNKDLKMVPSSIG